MDPVLTTLPSPLPRSGRFGSSRPPSRSGRILPRVEYTSVSTTEPRRRSETVPPTKQVHRRSQGRFPCKVVVDPGSLSLLLPRTSSLFSTLIFNKRPSPSRYTDRVFAPTVRTKDTRGTPPSRHVVVGPQRGPHRRGGTGGGRRGDPREVRRDPSPGRGDWRKIEPAETFLG